ncbi:MAG: 2-C-methyl-D-erythritol 4-phosphate cytidylyltransferase, partial [Calditrichaeota bacterium]|nr:2-C-methyl-D-erythritol 4-phosphate cytidylyltransferase [Calditrichota bacterium]
ILFYTLKQIEQCGEIDEIILSVPEEELTFVADEIIDRFGIQKIRKIVAGGKERQDSVRAAFEAIDVEPELVLVHDGVRPFVTQEILHRAIEETRKHGATVVGIPITATVKRVIDGKVGATLNRNELWEIQTPQTFRYDWFEQASEKAQADHFYGTDDASLLEHAGFPVYAVLGSPYNIKITHPEDLEMAELILKKFTENPL